MYCADTWPWVGMPAHVRHSRRGCEREVRFPVLPGTRFRRGRHAEGTTYPALTLAGDAGRPEVVAIPEWGVTKTVSVANRPILGDPGVIARAAVDAARDGAKVLVIRNTVNSAQAVFAELLAQGSDDLA